MNLPQAHPLAFEAGRLWAKLRSRDAITVMAAVCLTTDGHAEARGYKNAASMINAAAQSRAACDAYRAGR